MNNELMEQCRREAEEWVVSEVGKKLKHNTVDEWVREIIVERNDQSIQGYAAALYAERSRRRELTDEASHHLFMGWLHANHADINDNADVSDLCRRAFLDALRYARDNGYLAPAAGLTVEEVMGCLPGATERGQLNETWFRENLTAAIKAKASK